MKRTILITLIALAGAPSMVLANHNHHGGGDRYDEARRYADTATRHARQNERFGCGYRGSRWSLNYDTHFRWATRKGWHDLKRENDLREKYLRRCHGGSGYYGGHDRHDRYDRHDGNRRGHGSSRDIYRMSQREFARWYAKTATDQVRKARRLGCGYDSRRGRWSSNWDVHHRWALRSDRNKAIREYERREDQLRQCRRYAHRGH